MITSARRTCSGCVCMCEWAVSTRALASVCAAYTQFIFGCSLSPFSTLFLPATITQPDSNVKMLHICSMQTRQTLWVPYFWMSRLNLCAFFSWLDFFSRCFRSYTDRFNMTSCHYKEALHISKQKHGTKRKERKKYFHFLWDPLGGLRIRGFLFVCSFDTYTVVTTWDAYKLQHVNMNIISKCRARLWLPLMWLLLLFLSLLFALSLP